MEHQHVPGRRDRNLRKTIARGFAIAAFLLVLVAPPAAGDGAGGDGQAEDETECLYINPWTVPPVVSVSNNPLQDCI